MRVFTFPNPGEQGPPELNITLCLNCRHEGQMSWHGLTERPDLPPKHACGFCGAPPRFCVGCGCSDFAACEGGCHWIDPALTQGQDVCSTCYARAMREVAADPGALVLTDLGQ